ncbi:MAG: ABC transporter permease [bacterium]|nr:MAG: ABC transporter permease [bacterium]
MSTHISVFARKPLAIIKKEFLTAISYKFDFLFRFSSIWMSLFVYYFLAKLIDPAVSTDLQPYGGDYFSFVIIGTAFSSYLNVGLDSFSSSIREAQLVGTLEAVLVTRTRFTTILIFQAVWNFLFASIHVIVYLAFGFLFFKTPITNPNFPATIVVLILTILAFSSLGIISGSFIILFKKGTPINWFINNFSRFLGGVFYPISLLPDWCQTLAYLLPITHSLEAIRLAMIRGYSLPELRTQITALLIFNVVLFPLSVLCFNFAFRQARKDGTLCQY